MGRDKAMLEFNGETLLQRVADIVQPMFVHTLVSVRKPRADVLLPQICDVQDQGGPLVGLISALQNVTTPWAFVVACDMPFISSALIVQLAGYRAGHQAVVPRVDGYAQPLAAFYARAALPLLQASLDGGNRSLIGALKTLDLCHVDGDELLSFDPTLRSFFDLDTPQDVEQAINGRDLSLHVPDKI